MPDTVYKSEDLILYTETEHVRLVTKNCSESVMHMEFRAEEDLCADRFSLKLSLQKGTPAQIAEHFHFIPGIKQKEENIC